MDPSHKSQLEKLRTSIRAQLQFPILLVPPESREIEADLDAVKQELLAEAWNELAHQVNGGAYEQMSLQLEHLTSELTAARDTDAICQNRKIEHDTLCSLLSALADRYGKEADGALICINELPARKGTVAREKGWITLEGATRVGSSKPAGVDFVSSAADSEKPLGVSVSFFMEASDTLGVKLSSAGRRRRRLQVAYQRALGECKLLDFRRSLVDAVLIEHRRLGRVTAWFDTEATASQPIQAGSSKRSELVPPKAVDRMHDAALGDEEEASVQLQSPSQETLLVPSKRLKYIDEVLYLRHFNSGGWPAISAEFKTLWDAAGLSYDNIPYNGASPDVMNRKHREYRLRKARKGTK